MKRFTRQHRNSGIMLLDIRPKVYEEFKKNLFTALRKFGSGRKTRAVHKLIDNNLVLPAIFIGEHSNSLVAPGFKENVVKMIAINLQHFDDSLTGNGAAALGTELENIDKLIKKEETFVNEARLHKIEKLQEKKEETEEKFLKSLDYIKIIDGIYFGWLLGLAGHAVTNGTKVAPGIEAAGSDILASIIKKLYMQLKPSMDKEVHQLIDAIAVYFMRMYFWGESQTYILNNMKKGYKEEILDSIKRAKVTKIEKFNDLVKLLNGTELMPITTNTFDLQMQKFFGKYGYEEYVQHSLADYLAFMANLAHPNQLFKDSYPTEDKLHERLEELLLNEQKQIIVKEQAI